MAGISDCTKNAVPGAAAPSSYAQQYSRSFDRLADVEIVSVLDRLSREECRGFMQTCRRGYKAGQIALQWKIGRASSMTFREIAGVWPRNLGIQADPMRQMAPYLRDLRELDLSDCESCSAVLGGLPQEKRELVTSMIFGRRMSAQEIIALLYLFPRVVEVDFNGAPVNDAVLDCLSEDLESLSLGGSSGSSCDEVTDAGLTRLATKCGKKGKLTSLCFMEMALQILNTGILAFASNAPRLTRLALIGCMSLDPSAVQQFARNCKDLAHVAFEIALTPEDMQALLSCPIRTVGLVEMGRQKYGINDDKIRLLGQFALLESLSLLGGRITDDSLVTHLFRKGNLKAVSLLYVGGITDTAIRALSHCQNLHYAFLYSPSFTTEGVNELPNTCRELKYIDLNDQNISTEFRHLIPASDEEARGVFSPPYWRWMYE